MGTIAFQIVTTTDGTINRSRTISDAHADRLIAAYQEEANIAQNQTATRTQVWNYILGQVVATWIDKVKSKETDAATVVAASGVSPITIT